ncbi:MAG: BspA family leucine-rich repeat surface protein [Clostridia bacterium]|nr:BspA family leucine-rich repeat surface protein [Clostridia bacterium]
MNIRENRGITLTTLVVTVIVLLILSGVATSTGIEAIENTKHTKFVAELKIMQSYVNQWYEDCKPNSTETFEGNITNKFTAVNSKNATEDIQAQTTLTNANVLSAEFENFYLLEDEQKNALGVEGVSQKVLVSVKNRKVVSYDGLKWKNKMYYTIDDQSGEGLGEIYNVEYHNPHTNAPTIAVTGKSVYYGDTAKNAKYRFNVNVTQGSENINKGDLYYGKIENGSVRNWKKTVDTTLLVDREGTYQFYYKDAAGNNSNVVEYVIEPKATLISGADFNVKMKTLSGTISPTTDTNNTNITEFKIANTKPNNSILTDDYMVSTDESQYPIYMWFDNSTIWLWSEENWIGMNEDSSYMFNNLQTITNIKLSYFISTSKVLNMSYLFHNCLALTTLDVSSFDTANVSTMDYMFAGSETDYNNLNTSKDYSMHLTTIYGLEKFNTSKVTSMKGMFRMCTSITSLDLRSFDTKNVIDFSYMFYGSWHIGKVNMSLTEIKGLENFNTSKAEYIDNMFGMCANLTEINVTNFDTSNVTSMQSLFMGCSSITELDISNFNTNNVTMMSQIFLSCNNLKKVYVTDKFIIDNVSSSSKMFLGCTSLVGEKGTTYNTSHVDLDYAHIDGGTSNPGYFTRKE